VLGLPPSASRVGEKISPPSLSPGPGVAAKETSSKIPSRAQGKMISDVRGLSAMSLARGWNGMSRHWLGDAWELFEERTEHVVGPGGAQLFFA
jgi:hypothetical protein